MERAAQIRIWYIPTQYGKTLAINLISKSFSD